MTGVVKNIDDLITVAPVCGWDIQYKGKPFANETDVLEAGKMGKCKDLSHFDSSQIVMAK